MGKPALGKAFALDADYMAADKQTKRDDQRQDDEHDRKAAFGPAPSFPVGNPILHKTVPPGHSHSFGKVHVTDQREKNSTEL